MVEQVPKQTGDANGYTRNGLSQFTRVAAHGTPKAMGIMSLTRMRIRKLEDKLRDPNLPADRRAKFERDLTIKHKFLGELLRGERPC